MLLVFEAEDGIRDYKVTGVQTCALPISACSRARCATGDRRVRAWRCRSVAPGRPSGSGSPTRTGRAVALLLAAAGCAVAPATAPSLRPSFRVQDRKSVV